MVSSQVLTPDELLITSALYARDRRSPDLEAELAAYHELSATMASDPREAIQRFLELALELCPAAGSAGLSELTTDDDGQPVFRWTHLAGAFAPYVGGTTPRDFSPCGLCLGHHHPILIDRPWRLFTYFCAAEPEIVEGLIVPVYDTGRQPLGTIWVVSHEPGQRFDATDARVMEQLAVQLVLALKLRRKASVVAELEQVAKDKDTLVHEVHHRVKNTIQMAASLLLLQSKTTRSRDARTVLAEAQARLLVLAKVHEALHQPDAAGGTAVVDMGALARTLCASLRALLPSDGRIELSANCADVRLDTEQAIALGLIINEAATNALKHAFPADLSGEIAIELLENDGMLELTVRDNGVGFAGPAREGSLGIRLMRNLARQVNGTVEIGGTYGTTVTVRARRRTQQLIGWPA